MKKKLERSFELACNRLECYKQDRHDIPEKTACRLFRLKYVAGSMYTECVRSHLELGKYMSHR